MFIDLFNIIVGGVLTLVGSFFHVFNNLLPHQIFDFLNYFVSQMYMFSGIFPVVDLLACITVILTWWILFYGVEVILWLLSMLPWVKVPMHLPNHEISQDQRSSDEVNLKGRGWTNLRK